MKIVFLDAKTLGNDCDLSCFDKLGDFTVYDNTNPEQVFERISDAEAVITNKVVINKELMDVAPKLRYIGIAATGTNNVDLQYAKEKGIIVTNVKGYSTNTVVQHTFALLFSVLEHISHYDTFVKTGAYCTNGMFTNIDKPFMELNGKTWGIIGLGEIGRSVASVAQAFGCRVVYYSTSGKNDNTLYTRVELDELLKDSDIVSIHAPLTDATLGLIDECAFSKMKSTAFIINVGRGPIIDEKALAAAIDKHIIAGAGLDVYEKEPLDKDNPLMKLTEKERLIMTPHIAWASVEARRRLVKQTYSNLLQLPEFQGNQSLFLQ